jgi:hypothetical protein
MASGANISRFSLKPDKRCIITECALCYYIIDCIPSLQAEMDGGLMLAEKEFPINRAYDYADW